MSSGALFVLLLLLNIDDIRGACRDYSRGIETTSQ